MADLKQIGECFSVDLPSHIKDEMEKETENMIMEKGKKTNADR